MMKFNLMTGLDALTGSELFIAYAGIGLLAIAAIAFIWMLLTGMNSVKNGEELAEKYRYAADGSHVKAKGVIFFPMWRMLFAGNDKQVLPYLAGRFKRLYFMVQTIDYSMMGDLKKNSRGKLYLIFFARLLGSILLFLGIASLAAGFGFTNEANELLGKDTIEASFYIVTGFIGVISGFMVYLIPSIFLLTIAIPVIEKMDISDTDKRNLKIAIKINVLISVIALLIEIAQKIQQAADKNNK